MNNFFPSKVTKQLLMSAAKPFSVRYLAAVLVLFTSRSNAQIPEKPTVTAVINFNLESNSFDSTARQTVSLYGCNTVINVPNANGFSWNTPNQLLPGIPYGWQTDTVNGKITKYYVSKYYIASPPVFGGNPGNTKTVYDIGLVTPDEFVLEGEKPVQLVYLNYDILQPVYIKYFNVKFDESFTGKNQDVVPFKVECTDFPWTDKHNLAGAKGASGIGSLDKNMAMPERLFLPYYTKTQSGTAITDTTFLDCKVTILNDILLYNEVFFVVKGKHGCKKYVTSINLRDFKDEDVTITLHCKKRKRGKACGCVGS